MIFAFFMIKFEDKLFRAYIAEHLSFCNDAAFRIWQYVCAEMLNNAIEHSTGKNIYIEVRVNALYSVYCKIKLPKVAKQKWTLLHVQIGQSCNLLHKGS